jgi:hypothetical protein
MSPVIPFDEDELTVDYVLGRLTYYKDENGLSWKKVSDAVHIPKRTLMRWKQTSKISMPYRRLVILSLDRLERPSGH